MSCGNSLITISNSSGEDLAPGATLAPEEDLQKPHAPRAVVKAVFMFGFVGGGVCAPEHEWVSMPGRLQASHTCQMPADCKAKEALCVLAMLQGKWPSCSVLSLSSLF